eukprot:349801-Chlamydomonas_euryale.AAC.39
MIAATHTCAAEQKVATGDVSLSSSSSSSRCQTVQPRHLLCAHAEPGHSTSSAPLQPNPAALQPTLALCLPAPLLAWLRDHCPGQLLKARVPPPAPPRRPSTASGERRRHPFGRSFKPKLGLCCPLRTWAQTDAQSTREDTESSITSYCLNARSQEDGATKCRAVSGRRPLSMLCRMPLLSPCMRTPCKCARRPTSHSERQKAPSSDSDHRGSLFVEPNE